MATTRAEAMELGLDRYHAGEPCKYGHDSPRYTSSAGCVECTAEPGYRRKRVSTKPKVRVPQDDFDLARDIMDEYKESWDE